MKIVTTKSPARPEIRDNPEVHPGALLCEIPGLFFRHCQRRRFNLATMTRFFFFVVTLQINQPNPKEN